jgi:hypothetical protein
MALANPKHVGIIGAGRLGQAMARTALQAGRSVVIANSRGPESLTSVVSALGDRVSAATVQQAVAAGIVVIAVPWPRVQEALEGLEWNDQVVIDATNDFEPSDLNGRISSEVVADLVAPARVVKAATRRRRRREGRGELAIRGRGFLHDRPRGPGHGRRHATGRRPARRGQPDPALGSKLAMAIRLTSSKGSTVETA